MPTTKEEFLFRFYNHHPIPLKVGINEESKFYVEDKNYINDCTMHVFVIFVIKEDNKADEYLHAAFIPYPKNDFLNNEYFNECTHLLISEIIPFDEEKGGRWINAFRNELKLEYHWKYPFTTGESNASVDYKKE